MAVHDEQQDVVAGAVPAILGRLEQTLHFRLIEVVLRPLVGVGCTTLYVSPFGRLICPSQQSGVCWRAG